MHGMYWSVMFGWVPVSLIPSPNLAAAWRYHIWPFYKSNSVHIASGCITCVRLLCLSTLHCVTLHYIQNTHGTHGEYNLTYLNPSGGSIITLHDIALDCSITLYYIYTLHCVALHYIYIHYMTLRDVTLRCVTLHYIHNTHDTHGDVICYVCVCAWACDSCPTTRPQNQFNMKIMETVSTPSPNSLQQIQLQHTLW